jgi:hypothetical protein
MANADKIAALLNNEAIHTSFLEMPEPETPPHLPYGTEIRRPTVHSRISELSSALQSSPVQGNKPLLKPLPKPHINSELERHPSSPNSMAASNNTTPRPAPEKFPIFMPTYVPSQNHRMLTINLDATFETEPGAVHPFPSFNVKTEGIDRLGTNFLAYCYVRNTLIEHWCKSKGKSVPKEALLWPEFAVNGEQAEKRKSNASSGSDGSDDYKNPFESLFANVESSKAKKGKNTYVHKSNLKSTLKSYKTQLTYHSRSTSDASSKQRIQAIRSVSSSAAPQGQTNIAESLDSPTPSRPSTSFSSYESVGSEQFQSALPSPTTSEANSDPLTVLQVCQGVLKIVNRQLGDFSVEKEISKEEKRWKFNMERMEEADRKAWEAWKKSMNELHVPCYHPGKSLEAPLTLLKNTDVPMEERVRTATSIDKDPRSPLMHEFVEAYIDELRKSQKVPDTGRYQYRAAWAVRFVEWAEEREKRIKTKIQERVDAEEMARHIRFLARRLRYSNMLSDDPAERGTLQQQREFWELHEKGTFDPKPDFVKPYKSYGEVPQKGPGNHKQNDVSGVQVEASDKNSDDEGIAEEESSWERELEGMYQKEEERRRGTVRASTLAVYEEPQDD